MRDLEKRFVPVMMSGGPKKAVWMTYIYRARRAVIDKKKVFAR